MPKFNLDSGILVILWYVPIVPIIFEGESPWNHSEQCFNFLSTQFILQFNYERLVSCWYEGEVARVASTSHQSDGSIHDFLIMIDMIATLHPFLLERGQRSHNKIII